MEANSIIGTRYDDVVNECLAAAEAGDYRARLVAIGPRSRIVTPHRGEDGQLDRNDLAAQIYAICHDLTSSTGAYTGGQFIADGCGHFIAAPARQDQEQ